MERVLTIAGYDPSGGAGILMDIKIFTLIGLKGAGIPTALTFQNSKTFEDWIALDKASFERMLKLTFSDLPVRGVKIGMLANAELASLVSFYLKKYRNQLAWIVYDPVLRATLKKDLFEGSSFLETIKRELLPRVDFLTPNVEEAQLISNLSIENQRVLTGMTEIYKVLRVKHLIIKGWKEKERIYSYYFSGDKLVKTFSVKALPSEFHGTGCAFSSLLLGYLLREKEPVVAIKKTLRRLSLLLKEAQKSTSKEGLSLIH